VCVCAYVLSVNIFSHLGIGDPHILNTGYK